MKRIIFFICLGFLSVSFAQNRSDTIHVAHYEINLSIVNLPQQTITGYTDLKVVPRITPLPYCNLDIVSSLTVDSVLHQNQTVNFNHSGSLLRITFDNAITTLDTQSIRVYYQGKPAIDPQGGGFYITTDMAFNFGCGFSVNPPSFGRSWFPCIDEFTDKSTYTFCIRTDADKKAVCGGLLTDSLTLGDQTKFWKWELTAPIPAYLAAVAVGDFHCYKDTFHGINGIIPIEIYATSAYIGNVAGSFVNLKTVLRDYETRLGAYSWQRVGYVAVPFTQGAMEHATNITYPQYYITGNTQFEWIAFHELAHSWFGNLLTCSAPNTMWINEGFATYAQTMAEEALDPTLTRYKNYIREQHHDVLINTHIADGGYYALDSVPQNKTYGATSYLKGGMVVHTLRHYLGDSLFFSGLRTLYQQNTYGNVSSEQFFTKMSQITGVNLMDFYLGWVHQPGFLHFSIDSVVKKEQTVNQYHLYFKQKLHHAYYFADNNKIDVEFISLQGERHTLRHIQFSGEKACIDVTLPFIPAYWVIDPDENLSDAVIKYPFTVSNTNLINCDNAYFRLNPATITGNSDVRIDHHLLAPDPLKTSNADIYRISDNHYWHIQLYDNNITDGEFRFQYDPRVNQRDYTLFQGYTRTDLILLYRRNASEDWRIHPSSLMGSDLIVTRSLLSGEYTLAVGKNNVSVCNINSNSGISVYPNPATGELKIRISDDRYSISDIRLYDIVGREIATSPNPSKGGEQAPSLSERAGGEVVIDISHLASGMYFLKVDNKVVKFVKE